MKNLLRIVKYSKDVNSHFHLTILITFLFAFLMAGCNPDPVEQDGKQEDEQGKVLKPSIDDWQEGDSGETEAKENEP